MLPPPTIGARCGANVFYKKVAWYMLKNVTISQNLAHTSSSDNVYNTSTFPWTEGFVTWLDTRSIAAWYFTLETTFIMLLLVVSVFQILAVANLFPKLTNSVMFELMVRCPNAAIDLFTSQVMFKIWIT